MTLVQTAIKDIYIGAGTDDYSAMQGPAPSGFHVPSKDEWQAVYNVWTALGGGSSDGTNFGIALKLPFAGYRIYLDASLYSKGTLGRYWSSHRYNEYSAYYIYFTSSAIHPQYPDYRASGFSVRCFKNSPVIPTSSWTKLYGTSIESGGIFWNSTDGLISLSSDGQTWITIADKNLGATTVWNSGDALSETNCGKYYQRGNNYGFAWTGSVTTSSTQVDASNYGPGNYYSSSTFITYNGRWDTTDNGNLRGGETGVVKKGVSKVYLGSTQVRPTINFATQGPAPDGFHVPLSSEWQAVLNMGVSIGAWSTPDASMCAVLKMPFSGIRRYSSSNVQGQGSYGYFWCSDGDNDNRKARILLGYTTTNISSVVRSAGGSIRAFKNTFTTPDSNWTTLYQGTGNAGIFHNSSLGIISITSDGTTGYTISDKNLGATTVYNNGDTMSEANCGKYYQRGNNYGFDFSGAISNSSTLADTTGYGPGNYYSSNTFITVITSPYDRSSSQNDNLRGGEDGNVPV